MGIINYPDYDYWKTLPLYTSLGELNGRHLFLVSKNPLTYWWAFSAERAKMEVKAFTNNGVGWDNGDGRLERCSREVMVKWKMVEIPEEDLWE